MLYTVAYDVSGSDDERNALEAALMAAGPAIRCLESTWLLISELTAAQVRKSLEEAVSSRLTSLITEIAGKNNAWSLDRNRGVKEWRDQNNVQMS